MTLRAATSEIEASATAEQHASDENLTAKDELPPTDTPVESLTMSASVRLPIALQSDDPESSAQQNITAQALFVSTYATGDGVTDDRDPLAKILEPDAQTSDFDTKLLDDLIKNYGEFAANPNLPATLDKPKQETRTPEKLRPPKGHGTVSARSANDLDRQLKKLIKDYGENDLYSSRSGSLKTKLRVGGAFVVLALVLGGIYYFSEPKTVGAPRVNFIQKSTSGDGAGIAREPEPQKVSVQDENTQPSAGLEDLPPVNNRDIQRKQKKSEKGGTKR
jgi:hypothetical protein